jgi:hypothetical protein
MSSSWPPSPDQGSGAQSYPRATSSPPTTPPRTLPPPPHPAAQPPAGPDNSFVLWIILGLGACGLVSLCCVSGLLVLHFQQPAGGFLATNDNSALLRQESNPNLGQYRSQVMGHADLIRYVGKIESLEFDAMATLQGHDTESIGYKLKGSRLSGIVVAYESVVDGRKVLRKAVFQPDVFQPKGSRTDELWMAF